MAADQFGQAFRAEQAKNYGCAGDIECTFKMDGSCDCFNTALAAHRLSAKQEATREIVATMREAVEHGYPAPTGDGARSQCPHGKFKWEDCIACYDEFLWAKLDAIEQGQHTNQRDGV